MTCAMILQARMASTRLPGKILQKAGGRTILEWVIRSSQRVPGIDVVCVAVPFGEVNEPVVAEALRCGAVVTRGSETDVLDRFRVAAEAIGATEVMRVTTDCPLSDPAINGEVLALRRREDADYACNNEPFTFPHGLDCEAFTRDALDRAAARATQPYDREHVTPWLKSDASIRRAYLRGPGGERAQWRWTIDHPEDLCFFRAIAERLGEELSDWRKVTALLERHPELHDINRARRQRL